MKVRRIILILFIAGGFILLVLGISGVLSPETRSGGPVVPDELPPQTAMEAVVYGFSIQEENWSLQAAEARTSVGDEIHLVNPVLNARRPAADGAVQVLKVEAAKGTYTKVPTPRIVMSGNVSAEWQGEQKARLETLSLVVEPEAGIGSSDDAVTLSISTDKGEHTLQGEGVNFILKQRLVTVQKNIRITISGMGILKSSSDADEAVTTVTCDGPAQGDGFRRRIELQGNVRIQQSESLLAAQRVEAQFSEEEGAPGRVTAERVTAEGNVLFSAKGAEGRADRLIRTSIGDRILLEGAPARISHGASVIASESIELGLAEGEVFVPAAGQLTIKDEKAGDAADVQWSRLLRFNPEDHAATVRGDVLFSRGDQSVQCQLLTVKFDEDNRTILEARFETDVHLNVTVEEGEGAAKEPIVARGNSLVYDVNRNAFSIAGDASVERTGETISGERIDMLQADRSLKVTGTGRIKADAEQKQPLDVSWTGGMQYNAADRNINIQRDVDLRYGDRMLKSDSLLARVGESNRLQSFSATGDVEIIEPPRQDRMQRTVHADEVLAKMGEENQISRLEARGRARIEEKAENSSRILTADRIEAEVSANNELKEFTATGAVTVEEVEGNRAQKMTADKVEAYTGEDGQLTEFRASGKSVTLLQDGRTAQGKNLLWNIADQRGKLSGNPAELREGNNRLFGELIEFDRAAGSIRISGKRRVEATLVGGEKETGTLLK